MNTTTRDDVIKGVDLDAMLDTLRAKIDTIVEGKVLVEDEDGLKRPISLEEAIDLLSQVVYLLPEKPIEYAEHIVRTQGHYYKGTPTKITSLEAFAEEARRIYAAGLDSLRAMYQDYFKNLHKPGAQ